MDHNVFKRKWVDRTSLEKFLFFVVCVLLILVLVLLVSLFSVRSDALVCTKPECIKAANHILDMVDVSVDPCDDFYNFACGTFIRNNQQRSSLTTLTDLARGQLKDVIMGFDHPSYSRGVNLQRKFYQSCINESAIEKDNSQTLLKKLDELGGWPLLNSTSFDEGRFDWMSAMVKAAKIGLQYDFFLSIKTLVDETDRNKLLITPPYLGSLINVEYPEALIEMMEQVGMDLGGLHKGAIVEIRNTVNFIKEFNAIVSKAWNHTKNDDSDTKVQPINKLNQKYIYKPWKEFLNNLTDGIMQFKSDDEVTIKGEDYLRDLYFLLLRTNKRIHANYICWYILIDNMQFLKESIRNKIRHVSEDVGEEIKNRTEECFIISRQFFPYVAEGGFLRRYTKKSDVTDINEMIQNIRDQFSVAFKYNDWMDDETKKMMQERLESLSQSIGWTNFVYKAADYERSLEIDRIRFMDKNIINMVTELRRNDLYKTFSYINETVDLEYRLRYPVIDVNAYFIFGIDTLILPLPIIRGFIYDGERPNYMNYGALGSIIGHEFTHSFTLTGDHSYPVNNTWMTNSSMTKFHEKVQCVIEEYDKYLNVTEGLHKTVTSNDLVDENIADITGITVSYRAYRDYVLKNGIENNLPGIKFNQNQLFWIMSSTYLCESKSHKDVSTKKVRHMNSRLRVLGTLMNSPYFADDFNCPTGSRMNPSKKCSVLT
ncbi:neprilysin-2-like [Aethina tumida]|uniref:neprilysin-2-like n=1 Tax=Aethina tumida TaxID=116153 RepID=UPI0021488355|nr:neprilysin-2-like [Aethina tumida]